MLQGEESAILSIFIKLPFDSKIFVLYIFEWPLNTDFTIVSKCGGKSSLLIILRENLAAIVDDIP